MYKFRNNYKNDINFNLHWENNRTISWNNCNLKNNYNVVIICHYKILKIVIDSDII
jgi:hypothetical protein